MQRMVVLDRSGPPHRQIRVSKADAQPCFEDHAAGRPPRVDLWRFVEPWVEQRNPGARVVGAVTGHDR